MGPELGPELSQAYDHLRVSTNVRVYSLHIYIYAFLHIYVCIYVYTYIRMYICIYIYIMS